MTETAEILTSAEDADIRKACERLALDYSFYADAGRMSELAALFADDGEFHLWGQVHVGPAAVETSLSANPRGSLVTVHALANHRIDVVSATEAYATAYVTVYVGDKAAPAPAVISPFVVGTYHDVYRKTPAGWRFAKRAFEPLITRAG